MDTLEGRLDVKWTRFFDKFCEAEESFQLGGHGIKKGGSQNIHALHISEAQLLRRLLSVYRVMSVGDRKWTTMRFTIIPPDKSVKETDEHILSDSLLETTISS
jgi:hypothetical protein